MGGGGGFFGNIKNPEVLFDKVRDSESKTRNETFETKVSKEIASLLTKYNQRSEVVEQHLKDIIKTLEKDIEGSINLLFGGSVSKHTYVDGLSDIDALVIINKTELKDKSPEDVKDYFLDSLNARLHDTPIEKGTLAVTVKYSDVDVQLLPALRYKGGFRIADSTGKNWSFIKPQEFTDNLTAINKKTGGKLIPTIKLVKSITSSQPKNRQLESYHTETIALKIFKSYKGAQTPKEMLKYFFTHASEHIKRPMVDVTGQSTHVDDYLGSKRSLQRKIVSDAVERTGRRMKNADIACSVKQWREILGGL